MLAIALALSFAGGFQSTHGGAVGTGVRLDLGEHLALGFDLGYGISAQSPGIQDRWWLMPSAAFVFTRGAWRFDLGLGVGAATSSGFTSVEKLTGDHPTWAFQLMPAARAHVRAAIPLGSRVDLFTRLDAGAWLDHGGIREGTHAPTFADQTWVQLWVGIDVYAAANWRSTSRR